MGIIQDIEDNVLSNKFYIKDVLWSSDKESSPFDTDCKYIIKEIATKEAKKRVVTYGRSCDFVDVFINPNFNNFMEVNPHKDKFWSGSEGELEELPFENMECFRALHRVGSIKDYFSGKNDHEFTRKVHRALWSPCTESFQIFLKDFLYDFLLPRLDKYPDFLKERLLDANSYPGNFFQLNLISDWNIDEYSDNFYKSINQIKMPLIFNELYEKDFEDTFLFYEGPEYNGEFSLTFDVDYLIEYSDLICYANELEKEGLIIYDALNKIQAFDENDTIASRFLAEFVSDAINIDELDKIWTQLSVRQTFEETNKVEDPAEARAIEAFKIYRNTLKKLSQTIELGSKIEPLLKQEIDTRHPPDIYDDINMLYDKLGGYSIVPFNKYFSRESIERGYENLDEFIECKANEIRQIRNIFAHGKDINEEQFTTFKYYCEKFQKVAEETGDYIKMHQKKL